LKGLIKKKKKTVKKKYQRYKTMEKERWVGIIKKITNKVVIEKIITLCTPLKTTEDDIYKNISLSSSSHIRRSPRMR